jgi:hypothetical protein
MGLPVDNLIGDGFAVRQFDWRWVAGRQFMFQSCIFLFESLSTSNRQTKSYNGNKANKSNGYSTRSFTVIDGAKELVVLL